MMVEGSIWVLSELLKKEETFSRLNLKQSDSFEENPIYSERVGGEEGG